MKILLISATSFEIVPLLTQIRGEQALTQVGEKLQWSGLQIDTLITGVGLPVAAWSLGNLLARQQYDLLLQAGVAGALDTNLALGDVVEVVSECFADVGVEEADGSFTPLTEMGLMEPDTFPFRAGRLWNQAEVERSFLPSVHGISVNKVHGSVASIKKLKKQFPYAQVESMEGAAFFLAALQAKQPFLQIRAISNYVEPRNRDNWELQLAISKLNGVLLELLDSLAKG